MALIDFDKYSTHSWVKKLSKILIEKNQTIVTAESCTAGMLASALTSLSGSSQYFDCGFVTYSNASKSKLLGVDPILIATEGAVSEKTALAMCQGALQNSSAQIAIAITGIAGPSGALPNKPIGTVCFSIGFKNNDGFQCQLERKVFNGNRARVRQKAVIYALELTYRFLNKNI